MTQIILDHAQDVAGREIHRLTSLYPPPDFVKQADHPRLYGEPETQQRHLYGEPHSKLYPCHTPAATWMSTLFFADKRAQFEPAVAERIEANLDKAAGWFGIKAATDAIKVRVAADAGDELTKLANEDFAIVWKDDTGAYERHWPLRNMAEVKFAAAHYAKHRDEFTFPDRHMIATRIIEKAAQFGAGLGDQTDMLHKAAGRGACAAETIAEAWDIRAKLTQRSHAALSKEAAATATLVREARQQAREHDRLLKFAAVLDHFDRETKLTKLYDAGGLLRPEEVLFQVTEKTATDFTSAHVNTLTGNVYAVDDLEKLALDDVRSWMGDEFAEAVSAGGVFVDGSKLAAIVPTLDRGAASMFDRFMQAAKVAAVAREKAAANPLSPESLFALAASYQPVANPTV